MPLCARRGFALPAAIFLMVVLATLGAFIVGITTMQTSSSSLDVRGVNAYHAARAGGEWGAYQVLRGTAKPVSAATPCFGTTSFGFAGSSLSAFTATVSCSRKVTDETGVQVTVDYIKAEACNDPVAGACPNPNSTLATYVSRQVEITVGQP
jgi:MSHA biogenesis protein MshP